MKLLQIDSSALGAHSATRELTAALVGRLRQVHPSLELVHRDLGTDPIRHLGEEILTGADPAGAAESAAVLQEFLDADVIVVGAPMYNFSIPSTLKAWIDRISVAGKTFRYSESGPQGLAGGKRVLVATAAGGRHAGEPMDFVGPYLSRLFAFLGIDDVEFVRAEGLALSADERRRAIDAAIAQAQALPRAA